MKESEKKATPISLSSGSEEDTVKHPEDAKEEKRHKNIHGKKKEGTEIEDLKKKLEEKEKEAKETYDRFLRMAADFDNYKKRTAKEKEDWAKFAHEDLMRAILPFIDNLERAVEHAEKIQDTGVLIEGVRLTIQQVLQTLKRFGLSPFESVGKPFDPAMHEAMLVVESQEHQPNQVIQEFQKGYLLNERLLRPSSVSVSKPPQQESQSAEEFLINVKEEE